MRFLLLATFAVFAFIKPVKAQVETYTFDKAHTQILFFVNHLGFSMSQGEFLDYDGSFTFDRTKPENSKIDVTIKTKSIDMDDEKWNTHMKNEDFFHVEKYPNMIFKSTGVEVTGDKTAKIMGDLTILDVTKPVTLDVTHNRCGKHPFNGKYVCGFSATTIVNRMDYGMDYGAPHIGESVEVRLEVEGARTDDGL